MAWLRSGFTIVSGAKAVAMFDGDECAACRIEVEYLKSHPDAKAILIGRNHIALTGYFKSFWRFFWEVKKSGGVE